MQQRQIMAETGRLATLDFDFTVQLDMHEYDSKHQFVDVPRENGVFRLQQDTMKRVIFCIDQKGQMPLVIQR